MQVKFSGAALFTKRGFRESFPCSGVSGHRPDNIFIKALATTVPDADQLHPSGSTQCALISILLITCGVLTIDLILPDPHRKLEPERMK